MRTIIANFKYFSDTMRDGKRVESVLTKLQDAKPEEQNKEMIIVNYSEEGMCFFNIKWEINNIRMVQFNGTGA